MRNILIILLFLTFSFSARADEIYVGYFLKFTIEKANGEKIIGHVSIPSVYLNKDSLKSTEYLKKTLANYTRGSNIDSLTYYKYRIKYEYINLWDLHEKACIYALAQKTKLSFNSIKTITIDEVVDFSRFTEVVNELKSSDTSWLKKEPIKTLTVENLPAASYTFFVHKNSKKVDGLVKRLEKLKSENTKLGNQDGNKETAISIPNYDDELEKIIHEFNNEKVVVIADYID